MICLLPEKIKDFKKALLNREIKIADLLNMETADRINLLKEYAGENAVDVNKLFEQKLILKNRELGIKNALKKLTETGKYSPAEKARLDALKSEWKAAQQERIFSPKENEAFLNALADKITGTEITREESKTLFDLDRNVYNKLETGFDNVSETWKSEQEKFDYELAKLAYEKYYQSLLTPEIELGDAVKQYLNEYSNIYKEFEGVGKPSQIIGSGVKGVAKGATDAITKLFNASRKILSTADNSFFGTQGNQMMIEHPIEWAKQLINSFKRIGKEFYGINTFDPIIMKMYSDPNYINGRMQKAGIVNTEDEIFGNVFDSNIKLGKTGKTITKIPVISQTIEAGKRIDKAAESAFKGSSLLMRMYSFNNAINLAKEENVNVDDTTELKEIGDVINTAVGRGKINAKNPFDAVAKSILWSARLLKAKVNIFTNYFTAETPFAKKMALKSLIKFGFFIALVNAIAMIFNEDETKLNPLDSRFGKIPLGNKRYLGVDGGRLALITLFAKLLPKALGGGGRIDTKTNKFVPFSTAPNGSNRLKEIFNFLRNRLNPGLGATVDIALGQNSSFEEITPENIFMRNFVPISGQTAADIITKGPNAERFLDTALNFVGFPVSNYQNKKKKKK